MLESIRGIEKAIAGKTLRDYERSWLLRSAVERGIELVQNAIQGRALDGYRRHRQHFAARLPVRGRLDYLEGGQRRSAPSLGGVACAESLVEIAHAAGERSSKPAMNL